MPSRAAFTEWVADAYGHLYDLVYLRTHSLLDVLILDPSLARKQRAWQMHHLLVDVIDELKPGPQVSVLSRQWRRYQLMVLRYVKALDPEQVAEQLTVSRRHFYREHRIAIDALAGILWDRYVARPAQPETASPVVQDQTNLDRLALLRVEAARIAQADRYARVGDVIQGVLPLLQGLLSQHQLSVVLSFPEVLPSVSVERTLLRQVLLSVLGYLSEYAKNATITLTAQVQETAVCLSAQVEPSSAVCPAAQATVQERLAALNEMTAFNGTHVLAIYAGQMICGFGIRLPMAERIVLVVDDNQDVLELFRRYLTSHNYRMVAAQTAQEAIEQASWLQPHAITLDLMMPGQDGWDLLQTLLNRPDTQRIPILVCSVLKQKELVLSLGAVAFLEKPVTEQALLSALDALEAT